MSLKLLQKGIPVAQPVAFIETRHRGIQGESYFLSVFAENMVNLKAYANSYGVGFLEDGRLLIRIGDAVGRMHRAGCVHGDLKWSNFIVSDPTGDARPLLVDLEHGRCRHRTSESAYARDLARFMVDILETGLSSSLSKTFLDAYFKAAGLADGPMDRFEKQMSRVASRILKRHNKAGK